MGSFHHNTQIENESKVAQEESSETYEKAPQDACEIQVNNSQHPDLGHFTYRTNTMTTQPPRLRHLPHQLLRLFQHSRSHAQFGTTTQYNGSWDVQGWSSLMTRSRWLLVD